MMRMRMKMRRMRRIHVHHKAVGVASHVMQRRICSQSTMSHNTQPMIRKNRQLVTNEPVKFEK
jgi:hypothetical protein